MNEVSNNLSGNALAPYLGKLGLHTEPFSNKINDEFFLLDSHRAQHLNMLYHLAQNSELMLVVTGVQGSGKTSLLQHFIDMGDETWRSCVIDANAMMNPEQLLIQIAEGFGLPQDSVNFDNGIEMLNKRLIEMKRSELVSILVIDDAHELPAASLTMLMKLSELSDDHEGLLRFVLFSEPQLVEILNASSLKDVRYRVTHTLEMPALSEQETINYIQHRLTIAGLKDATVFSKNQLKKIYRASGGIPGKINQLAHQTLLGKQTHTPAKKSVSNTKKLRSSITVLIILAMTIGITWFFTRDALNKLSEHLTEKNNHEHDAVTMAQQTTKPLPLMPAKPITPPAKPDTKVPSATNMASNITDDTTTKKKVVNAYSLRQPDIQTKPITTIDKSQTPVSKPETANLTPATGKTIKPVVENQSVVPKKPTVSKPTTIDKTKTVIAAKPLITKPTEKSTVKPAVTKTVTRNWISQQNPKHFTLQVMGSHERSSITTVMHAHKLSSEKAAVLHTRLNNKDWFILVYGNYSNRDKARAAVRTLPRGLQITKPWPRQIGDIKLVK